MSDLWWSDTFDLDENKEEKNISIELSNPNEDLIQFPDIYLPVTTNPQQLSWEVKKMALSQIGRQNKIIDTRFAQISSDTHKEILAEIKKYWYIKNTLLKQRIARIWSEYIKMTQERFSPKKVQVLIDKIRADNDFLNWNELDLLKEVVSYTQIMLMQNPELMNSISWKTYLFSQRQVLELQWVLSEFSSRVSLQSDKLKLAWWDTYTSFKWLLEVFQQFWDQWIASMVKKIRLYTECVSWELLLRKVVNWDDLAISKMDAKLKLIKDNLDIWWVITCESCLDEEYDKDIKVANNLVDSFVKKYTYSNDIDEVSLLKRMILVYNEDQLNNREIQERKKMYSKSVAVISSKTIQSMWALFGIVSSLQAQETATDSDSLMKEYSHQVKLEYYAKESTIDIWDAVVGNMVFFELVSTKNIEKKLIESITSANNLLSNKDVYTKYYLMWYDDPLIVLWMLCHYTKKSNSQLDEINKLRSLRWDKALRNNHTFDEYHRVFDEWILWATTEDIMNWIENLGTLLDNVDIETSWLKRKDLIYEALQKVVAILFYKLLLNNWELRIQDQLYSGNYDDSEMRLSPELTSWDIINYYTQSENNHIRENVDDVEVYAKKRLRKAIDSFESLDNILDWFEDHRIITFLQSVKNESNALYDDCMDILEEYIFNEWEDLALVSSQVRWLSKTLLALRSWFTVEAVRKKVAKCIDLFQRDQNAEDTLLISTPDQTDENPDLDASLLDDELLFDDIDLPEDDILEISDENPYE